MRTPFKAHLRPVMINGQMWCGEIEFRASDERRGIPDDVVYSMANIKFMNDATHDKMRAVLGSRAYPVTVTLR